MWYSLHFYEASSLVKYYFFFSLYGTSADNMWLCGTQRNDVFINFLFCVFEKTKQKKVTSHRDTNHLKMLLQIRVEPERTIVRKRKSCKILIWNEIYFPKFYYYFHMLNGELYLNVFPRVEFRKKKRKITK